MIEDNLEISNEGVVYCGGGRIKLMCAIWLDPTERCPNCPLNHLVGLL